MLDRIEWPSQLEQVELYLKKAYMRLHVQKLSGHTISIEVNTDSTLQDLKNAICRTELALQGLSLSLVLGDNMLRNEFQPGGCSLKRLEEYGITHGATLSLIAKSAVTVLLRNLSGGPLVPCVLNAATKLKDLREVIHQKEGIMSASLLRLYVLHPDSYSVVHGVFEQDKTLAECGIDEGTILGWESHEPTPFCLGKENVNPNANVNTIDVQFSRTPKSSKLSTLPKFTMHTEDELEPIIRLDTEQCTPKRSPRPYADCMFSANKAPRTRGLKSKDAIKRL